MLYDRDEYISLMRFESGARPMLTEIFGLMGGLAAEWRAQGATENEINLTAFDLDYVKTYDCGANVAMLGGLERARLEETDDYIIERDSLGRTTKLFKKVATIPLPLDYPVKTMDDWLKLKPMFVYDDRRINWDYLESVKKARDEGALITAWLPGGFAFPRDLMGDEYACVCYYEDPELMADIINTATDTAVRVFSQVVEHIKIDRLHTGEDLAGKSGPLVGPKQVNEIIAPYYRAVWEILSANGAKIFSQDSDGNTEAVIADFLEAGVNLMYPMEPAAGMDVVKLRGMYGERLAFTGGIDKHVLREDKAAIRKELEYKIKPEMLKGTAFGLDHRVTDGTPIKNYRYYINTTRELLGREPVKIR